MKLWDPVCDLVVSWSMLCPCSGLLQPRAGLQRQFLFEELSGDARDAENGFERSKEQMPTDSVEVFVQ